MCIGFRVHPEDIIIYARAVKCVSLSQRTLILFGNTFRCVRLLDVHFINNDYDMCRVCRVIRK